MSLVNQELKKIIYKFENEKNKKISKKKSGDFLSPKVSQNKSLPIGQSQALFKIRKNNFSIN